MSRSVQLVLVCEDQEHEAFARRFLERAGWGARRLRVQRAPSSRGSAEQFVRKRFPIELSAYRSNRHRLAERLVVFIDGDRAGVAGRLAELEQACRAAGAEPRRADELVAVFVPTWCIETWFAYLDGADVDEGKADYPRLSRPRECHRHAHELHAMCQRGALRQPAPPSLVAACSEYHVRLEAQRT